MFACRTLVASNLSSRIEWIKLDTTSKSVPAPPVYLRAFGALYRVCVFVFICLVRRPGKALIFCSAGYSVIEKGVMCLLAKIAGMKTILAPRSGLIAENIKSKSFAWFLKIVLKRVDIVICQAEFWQKFYNELCGLSDEKKFITIHNWIDPTPYLQFPIERNEAEKTKKLLYLGWVLEYKGIFDLLYAFKKVEYLPIQLLIGGNGASFAAANELVIKLGLQGRIDFKGWVNFEQKMELLKTCDLYIQPSHFEGFPNALLEAMAAGIPCIATRVGAVPDVITGVNGITVPAKDPGALAEAIETFVVDQQLRITFANKARKDVLAKYVVEKAVDKFSAIL